MSACAALDEPGKGVGVDAEFGGVGGGCRVELRHGRSVTSRVDRRHVPPVPPSSVGAPSGKKVRSWVSTRRLISAPSRNGRASCGRTPGSTEFDPDAPGEIYSIDTPPPYVSAAHLHVGHAMSYSQAEFIVRYQRMRGRNVFYPMGFDDNGLPTERFVEKKYGINKAHTTRSEFRELCLKETGEIAVGYERFWRKLGLSVDWRLRYSTIDDHCRRTAQRSFLDLHAKGRVYRSEEPVFWDPSMQTSLAQADLETITRNVDVARHRVRGTRRPRPRDLDDASRVDPELRRALFQSD